MKENLIGWCNRRWRLFGEVEVVVTWVEPCEPERETSDVVIKVILWY